MTISSNTCTKTKTKTNTQNTNGRYYRDEIVQKYFITNMSHIKNMIKSVKNSITHNLMNDNVMNNNRMNDIVMNDIVMNDIMMNDSVMNDNRMNDNRMNDSMMYDNRMNDNVMNDSEMDNNEIMQDLTLNKGYDKKTQLDFIIGRGRNLPKGFMNIPMNVEFEKRNVIFIDPDPRMNADIKQWLRDVDFRYYGIFKDQDPDSLINLRFIFDWSSFYCGAIDEMINVISKIDHQCEILVPLDNDEHTVPDIIKQSFNGSNFNIMIIHGYYPLFDPRINLKIINPFKYIVIKYR